MSLETNKLLESVREAEKLIEEAKKKADKILDEAGKVVFDDIENEYAKKIEDSKMKIINEYRETVEG